MAEVITDGEDALLVPPGDVPALTAALLRLREDAALRQHLAANARAKVLTNYTWARRAGRILQQIEHGLASS